MMLFKAASVRGALAAWSNKLLPALDEAIIYTRHMGYLRICNSICNLGCPFKKKVKLTRVWDDCTHRFVSEWRWELQHIFLDNCKSVTPQLYITEHEELDWFISGWELDKEPWEYICQGHDTVWTLSVLMMQNSVYSEANIMSCMVNSYGIDDFRRTQLFSRIVSWAERKSVVVFKN